MTQLEVLILAANKINNFTPLATLCNLKKLKLIFNF